MDYASILQALDSGQDPFAPSEQDRKDALTRALFAFGAGTLAAPSGGKGFGGAMRGVGQGAMMGMGAYQNALADAGNSRQDKLKMRVQLAQLIREQKKLEKQDRKDAALERAKRAGLIPGGTVTESLMGAPGEGEAPTQYQTQTPGGFDPQKFLQAYMAEPDSDPLEAIDLQNKLKTQQGWQRVGEAPGGGDLYIGPNGKPEVIGKASDDWQPVQQMDNGILYVNKRTGEPKLVHNTAPKTSVNVGGTKVVLDSNAKQGSEYFHKEMLPKMEAAKSQNARLQSMLKMKLDTNIFTPENKTFTAVLGALGLSSAKQKEYVGNVEAFQADAMKVVLDEQQAQKGPQTDKDFERIQATVPSLRNSPKGNEYIIRLRMAQNNRLIRQARFIGERTAKGEDYINALNAWEMSPDGQSSIFDEPALAGFSFNPAQAGGAIRQPGGGASINGVTVRRLGQ